VSAGVNRQLKSAYWQTKAPGDNLSEARLDRRVGYIRQPRTMLLVTSRHPIMINVWQQSVAKVIALSRPKFSLERRF